MSANETPLNLSLWLWLWRHGVPTASALRLAEPQLVADLDAAPKPGAWMKQAGATLPAKLGDLTGAERLIAAGTMLSNAAKPRVDAVRACEADVVAKLRSGQILALGFEAPRRQDDPPALIERHALPPSIWLDGKPFKRGSLTFEDVRLLRGDDMAQLVRAWEATQAPSAPTPKQRGPEGVQRRIEAAYAAMKAAGEINFAASMSAHFPALRRRLIAAYPDAGYGATRPTDETLRKTFRDLFRDKAVG